MNGNLRRVPATLDLKTLLASVEAAPPIDGAEVVAAALTEALGARDVSFLIADYSGRSLIRLSHVRRTNADDDDVNRERSQAVPLAGTLHGRALASQEIQIDREAREFRVIAPVTSRGEAGGGGQARTAARDPARRGGRRVGAGTRRRA